MLRCNINEATGRAFRSGTVPALRIRRVEFAEKASAMTMLQHCDELPQHAANSNIGDEPSKGSARRRCRWSSKPARKPTNIFIRTSSSCRFSAVAPCSTQKRGKPFKAGSLFHFPVGAWHAPTSTRTRSCRDQPSRALSVVCSSDRQEACRSCGSVPPFCANFAMTCLCNHTFMEAESVVSPV